MSRLLLPLTASPSTTVEARSFAHFLSSEQFVAISFSVMFHIIVTALLLAGWQENKPVAAVVKTIKVRMLMQVPAPAVEVSSPPVQMETLVAQTPTPIQKQTPKPVIKEAKFAKKRVEKISEVLEESLAETLPATEATPNQEAQMSAKQVTEQANSKVESQEYPQPQASAQPQTNTESAANFDSSQYFPVDKKAPAYPSRALDKGIQGACTVRYTVTTDGRVENPEAMDDCHAFFIKPSLEATKSFRYTPRMVNGKAVKVPNVKNTFQYRIE